MNFKALAFAVLASAVLAAPVAASASTIGTTTSSTVTNTQGCLTDVSNSKEYNQGYEVAVATSNQYTGSVSANGEIGGNKLSGTGNITLQHDFSGSLTVTQFSGSTSDHTVFQGGQSSTTVSNSSGAFTSDLGQ
jgi:hypothetical protein